MYIYIHIYGAREHERIIKGTGVNKSNAKCFENEPQNLHSKNKKHIPAEKNQTLTKIR